MAQRYGTRSPRTRLLWVISVTALATCGLVWLAWAAWFHSTPEVRGGLISFSVESDRQVSATFDTKVSEGSSGSCILNAIASDHVTVGEIAVPVDSSGRQTISFRTERRATAVELVGCGTK